jgi:hypothetical protein
MANFGNRLAMAGTRLPGCACFCECNLQQPNNRNGEVRDALLHHPIRHEGCDFNLSRIRRWSSKTGQNSANHEAERIERRQEFEKSKILEIADNWAASAVIRARSRKWVPRFR